MAIYKGTSIMENPAWELMKSVISKITFAGALYLGAYYNEPILRIIDGLMYRNVPVEKGFFTDARGWHVETKLNGNGKIEYYLNYQNLRRIPLTYEALSELERIANDLRN
jgi:hypothetical protein